jgi:hypothetical protein
VNAFSCVEEIINFASLLQSVRSFNRKMCPELSITENTLMLTPVWHLFCFKLPTAAFEFNIIVSQLKTNSYDSILHAFSSFHFGII